MEGYFAILMAASFTLGCVIIHAWREQAKAVTPPLLLTAIGLGMIVGLMALAGQPEADARTKSGAVTTARR